MTPDEYCQDRAARSGSSFYYSFLFLPPERRRAITALYAFCREVDDVVDEARDRDVAATKLQWWRGQVRAIYDGTPLHPVALALKPVVGPFGIRQAQLEELIDGMQMDLYQTQYPDPEALRVYCRRVAGVVGEMSASIFGSASAQTLAYADRLGLAFQLTNIIRDVGEDARNGRVYLPQSDLHRHGLDAARVLALEPGLEDQPQWRAMLDEQIGRARQAYREAFALLPPDERAAQRPGLMMAAIYATLLDEIARDGGRVLSRRTALTPLRKLWLAWKVRVTNRPPAIAAAGDGLPASDPRAADDGDADRGHPDRHDVDRSLPTVRDTEGKGPDRRGTDRSASDPPAP